MTAEFGTGRRIVVRPDGRAETEEFPVTPPSSRELLIRTEYTAISAGTELGTQEQTRAADFRPGYSNVGRVIACGEGVTEYAPGDRVLSSGNHASHVLSSLSSPYLCPVPSGADSRHAAFGVIGMVAMHGARKARVEWGEHVVVVGAGMVGQLTLQLLARCGAETLTSVDLSSFRLRRAAEHGATHTVNPQNVDVRDALNDITGGHGVDVVVEASGYPEVLPAMFDALRIGGRCVLLGSIWHRPVTLDLMPFHEKELTLIGCHQPKSPDKSHPYYPWSKSFNARHFLERVADGRIEIESLITHVLSPADAGRAYSLLRESRDEALGVLFDFVAP